MNMLVGILFQNVLIFSEKSWETHVGPNRRHPGSVIEFLPLSYCINEPPQMLSQKTFHTGLRRAEHLIAQTHMQNTT